MGELIEHIYAARQTGQAAQLKSAVDADQLAQAFAATVADLQAAPARGAFHPADPQAVS